MDSENIYVDVCGEGENEEDKENCGNGTPMKNAWTLPMGKRQLAQTRPSSSQDADHYDEDEEGEDSEEEEGQETTTTQGGTSGDGRHEKGNPAKRRGGAPRKEKSLGRLCNRFLERMGEESRDGRDIHLESVARKMSVEKRRIYDIVNVMEALEAMNKTNKSFYRWHGLGQLPKLIHALQNEALQSNLPQRVDEVAKKMCTFVELNNTTTFFEEGAKSDGRFSRQSPSTDGATALDCSSTTTTSNDLEEGVGTRDRCGKNSLAHLCRRFLMVLLSKKSRKVSLDVTSTVLIKNPDKDGFEPPPRSKCRRLYDIANVLVAMRLILKKHALFGTKKIPLFEYCGPEPDADPAAGPLRMLEFLQRSGLTKVAAESVKVTDEGKEKQKKRVAENEQQPKKKEHHQQRGEGKSRKRKGEFNTGGTAEVPIKKEVDEPTERQRELNSAKKAKIEHPTTDCANATSTTMKNSQLKVEGQLPRPKPMLPTFPIGPFEVGGPSTAQSPLPTHATQPPNALFCPIRPQQNNLSFCWPPQMALFSSLISRHPAPHPSHPSSSLTTPQHFASFPLPTPPTKIANVDSVPKVRHSVQSILGASQKENIGKMSSPVASTSNVRKGNSIDGSSNVCRPFAHQNAFSSSPKAFKPVLQQRQNNATSFDGSCAKDFCSFVRSFSAR